VIKIVEEKKEEGRVEKDKKKRQKKIKIF